MFSKFRGFFGGCQVCILLALNGAAEECPATGTDPTAVVAVLARLLVAHGALVVVGRLVDLRPPVGTQVPCKNYYDL